MNIAYSLTFLQRLKKRLEKKKRLLGNATVFESNLDFILKSNDPLKKIVGEDTNEELIGLCNNMFVVLS